MSLNDSERRVLSGMRPSGRLHLGHYQGVLKNWVKLQHEYDCYFCIVDWHALTTEYADTRLISQHVMDMAVDWLAAGVSPSSATLFVQSQVPEHAELHLLLSMICPLSWLERVPSYKEQQEHQSSKDLATYGFLGYPLLQAADILLYRAGQVPVGADQLPHIEFAREVARRFNHLYGSEPDFELKAQAAIGKLGRKVGKLYSNLRKAYQEQGDIQALETARALLKEQTSITLGDQERLYGYLEGGGKVILSEPQPLLTEFSRVPGLDGQKMANASGNAIFLRDSDAEIEEKLRRMTTDPARVHRDDPGEPQRCPVWSLHQLYSSDEQLHWVMEGCRSASIGCVDCKSALCSSLQTELAPLQQRAIDYAESPDLVRSILAEGAEHARDQARETLAEVRQAMGLNHR
ncbi:tryptophan--tRNA ligase [Ectopseudomonas mendocina]|uniref:tryptophan--tRNA ligase n=1 Tax=Ectopseudomonas mendocina TaxID=300 RepID=UPI003132DDF1